MNTPTWFKVVAVLALLWNLLGCFAFFTDLRLSPEDLAKMPDAQQALYAARASWAVSATAIAVFGGALGSIGLLLRKKWAYPVFVLSLLGIFVQDFGLFVLADGASLGGPVVVALQAVVLAVGIGLVLLSRKGIARSWLL
jgi:Co/Zn/Cd efflux system component